jgi:hypothetical protein
MACDKCGAKRGHVPGCEKWAEPIKRRRRNEPKPDDKPVNRWVRCGRCRGDTYLIVNRTRRNPAGSRITCPECRGYGKIPKPP